MTHKTMQVTSEGRVCLEERLQWDYDQKTIDLALAFFQEFGFDYNVTRIAGRTRIEAWLPAKETRE